jgi:hypothetical protein
MAELVNLKTTKSTEHDKNLQYYDAEVLPVYLNERMRVFFAANPHYTQNWMSLVVDAVLNKLIVEGLAVEGDKAKTDALDVLWDSLEMPIEADLVHEMTHATGEGFIVAGLDDGNPVAFAHDPRTVVVYYGGKSPRDVTQAAHFWLEGNQHMATAWQLDDAGAVWEETLVGQKQTSATETAATSLPMTYTPQDELHKTPYGLIPIWHFRRSRRNIVPEFRKVRPLQDSINKIFTALGYTIEHAANKVRWAITTQELTELARANAGDAVAIAPAPAGMQPVSLGEFQPEQFSEFADVIERWISAIGAITATPRHYFGGEGMGTLSGEALQAMEAPLIAKVRRYQRAHATQWESLGAFLLTQSGKPTTTDEVTCNYADARTVLPMSQAQIRLANVQAGMPLSTVLRDEGERQVKIDQVIADKRMEAGQSLDPAQNDALYEALSAKAAAQLEPMLEQALTFISDAALAKLATPENFDRLARAAQVKAAPGEGIPAQ